MSKFMYILDKYESDFIEELSDLTGVDYGLKGRAFPINSFMSLLKDLHLEIVSRDEEIENYKENYRPITDRELYGDYEDYRREKGIIN